MFESVENVLLNLNDGFHFTMDIQYVFLFMGFIKDF